MKHIPFVCVCVSFTRDMDAGTTHLGCVPTCLVAHQTFLVFSYLLYAGHGLDTPWTCLGKKDDK